MRALPAQHKNNGRVEQCAVREWGGERAPRIVCVKVSLILETVGSCVGGMASCHKTFDEQSLVNLDSRNYHTVVSPRWACWTGVAPERWYLGSCGAPVDTLELFVGARNALAISIKVRKQTRLKA